MSQPSNTNLSAHLLPSIEKLSELLNRNIKTIEWLAGDGSDRCYYRISLADSAKTFVLMALSEEDQRSLKNGAYDWVLIQNILESYSITTPHLVLSCPQFGCLIIEDYGDQMLETKVHKLLQSSQNNLVVSCYKEAVEQIAKFLNIPTNNKDVWCSRSFDSERLSWELHFFKKYFLEQYLGLTLNQQNLKDFNEQVSILANEMSRYSLSFVHRDFHSRNLMVRDQKLAVIDFQDARLGAAAYDLISLVYDSYIPFTVEARSDLFKTCLNHLKPLVSLEIYKQIQATWQMVLLQRQLKVLGSFAYLNYAKNKPNYLQYIPVAFDTLFDSPVYDSRWPFLSNDLLELIHAFPQVHVKSNTTT